MGRLKIKQEDGNNKHVAYLDEVQLLANDIDDLQDNKVDKVVDKGLSTNDYTTAEKNKLTDIEAEANKTIITNNLAETVVGKALDATQGKILGDKIGVLSTMPTTEKTNLAGAVGEVKNELVAHKEDYANLVVEVNKKANKQQEEWITPTLLNGWTANNGTPQYFKDSFGIVHFKGGLNPAGKTSIDVFILPISYRPSETIYFNFTGGTYIAITATGTLQYSASTQWQSLLPISFRV